MTARRAGKARGALRIARAIEMQSAGARNPGAPGPRPAKAGAEAEPGSSASMSAPGMDVAAAPFRAAGGDPIELGNAAGQPSPALRL
ncbi:MAG TPA: hypothetical protein VGR91_19810 [Stellaceae bacterium]|nr:hypothetical protein [Stellaceae bacterium]